MKDFFFLNLNQYENISVNFPIGVFLILLTVAMCAAVFIINYRKYYTASMLKQLLRHGALDEQNAKTLSELRLTKVLGLKSALTRSGQLTFFVKRAGHIKPSYEEYIANTKKRGFKEGEIDFSEARYYLDAEKKEMAEKSLDSMNAEWWRPTFISAIFIAILILAVIFLPDILELINSAVRKG